MTPRHFKKTVVLFVFLTCAVPCLGAYSSIQINLIPDGIIDTTFDVSSGEFRIFSDANDALLLHDPTLLPGTITNTVFDLHTNLDVILDGPLPTARFVGGELSLTFDYDDGSGPQPYFIGGPLAPMLFQVTFIGNFSRILGEGSFAASWNLPGSNDWPSSEGDIELLSVFIRDLTGWNWDEDLEGNTTLSLLPHVIPEPSVLLLLVGGFGAMLRRNRKLQALK